jgi:radical SAM protein with 4Fe4S-binding SPASM domain
MSGRSHFAQLSVTATERAIPLEVSIELTHRCNLRCRHCYIPDLGSPARLDTDRLLRLLHELAEAGTLFLALTGGEPLLEPDWLPLAREARRLGFVVSLLSNGTLIDERAADALARLAVSLHVTLFSVDPAVTDAITGAPGSCAQTRRGIEALRARGGEVLVKTPLLTLNRGAANGVAAYAASVGAEFQAFPDIMPRSDGDPAPLTLRLPARELPAGFELRTECPVIEPLRATDPLCAAGRRYGVVTPGGDLLACGLLPTSAGNLRERSFRDVWAGSPVLQELRRLRRGDLPTCGPCRAASFCQRCPAQALLEDGDLLGPSRRACERAGVRP